MLSTCWLLNFVNFLSFSFMRSSSTTLFSYALIFYRFSEFHSIINFKRFRFWISCMSELILLRGLHTFIKNLFLTILFKRRKELFCLIWKNRLEFQKRSSSKFSAFGRSIMDLFDNTLLNQM